MRLNELVDLLHRIQSGLEAGVNPLVKLDVGDGARVPVVGVSKNGKVVVITGDAS